MVIPCSLHNMAIVTQHMDNIKGFHPVARLCFVALVYNIKADKKKTEDKVSARPTTPVTWNQINTENCNIIMVLKLTINNGNSSVKWVSDPRLINLHTSKNFL